MNTYKVPHITRKDKTEPSYVACLLADEGYRFFSNKETGVYLLKHNDSPYRDLSSEDEHDLKCWAVRNCVAPSIMKRAVAELADLNPISLIRDSLLSLRWNKKHTIAEIAESLLTPYHYTLHVSPFNMLKAWMIGAVGKVLGDWCNSVLVIESASDIGARDFVRWLCSGVESVYLADELDFRGTSRVYNTQRYFLWEITNLDRIKSSDTERFIDLIIQKEGTALGSVHPRKLNASFIATAKMQKHACMASYFCKHWFFIMPLGRISDYYTNFDPKQAWAEAVVLWRSGERGWLDLGEQTVNELWVEARNPYKTRVTPTLL